MSPADNNLVARPAIYQARKWTDRQLVEQGFQYYRPVKRVTMARVLPQSEAPKIIKTQWDTLVARAGYIIAYVAGDTLKHSLDEYEPRPIEPKIFAKTYKTWDDARWKPSQTERHLMSLGCKPFYKVAGVWAKKLKENTYVQSIESSKPVLASAGAWLCVGTEGEPWTVDDSWFHTRYLLPGSTVGGVR
ncbi:MAG: hypothetical protein GC179_07015 [Anaerolineaceae bacterium]|nr:hypothetical protein [Anaerolineaceae bacterium]